MKFVKEHMKQCLLPLAFVVAAATAEETVPSLLDGNMTVIEEPIFSVTFDGKLVAVDIKEKTECTLPPFVKSVARTAFAGCSNLVSVTIPSTVTNIECALMEPVEDYPGVIVGYDKLRVTYSPFDDCLKLRNVSVSQYVCDIGLPIVFGNAREVITNVIFDSSVTNIRNSTIDAWYRIRRVETGDLVGIVGCSNIESVTFSTDVTMVRERVTMEPKKYELAYQPPPLGEKHGIFSGSRLRRAVFADGVTRISDYAFDGCGRLDNVFFPASVRDVGAGAFWGCTNLIFVNIPAGVTNIGDWAFAECHRLSDIIFNGNAPRANSSIFGIAPEGMVPPGRFDGNDWVLVQDMAVGANFRALVMEGSTGWGVDIPGCWNGVSIDYLVNILNTDIPPRVVLHEIDISSARTVLTGFADPDVALNAASDAGTWQEYLGWADSIGISNAATSTTSWMSFALGSPVLLEEPKDGDLKIDDIEPAADGNSVNVVFSLEGVDVADTEAVVFRLSTVFDVQGSEDLGNLAPISPTFEVKDGKVSANVSLPEGANSYFMKVKIK